MPELCPALACFRPRPQMTSGSAKGSVRRSGGQRASSALEALAAATIARPLPWVLTPEALAAAAGWLARVLAVVVFQSAVLTVPLSIWLVVVSLSGSGRATLVLPAAVAAPLGLARPIPLHPGPVLLAVLGLVAAHKLAEAKLEAERRAAALRAARALRPERLQACYAGWALPVTRLGDARGAAGASGSSEEEELVQVRAWLHWSITCKFS